MNKLPHKTHAAMEDSSTEKCSKKYSYNDVSII